VTITVAIDAMGGDHGPAITLPGAFAFLAKHGSAKIILVGDEPKLSALLARAESGVRSRVEIVHTTQVVGMDESPQSALKNRKDSSMRVSINLVKEGRAQACVSAGNTGALMATARFVLKMPLRFLHKLAKPSCLIWART
jgi:phosphate acyltransferase